MDRGVVLTAAGAPPELAEIDATEPGARDVVVRIEASGVCRSDLHVLEHDGWGHEFPILLGHEGAGVVEAVGDEVTTVAPGDRVVLAWKSPCGECAPCRRGEPGRCRKPVGPESPPRLDGSPLAGVLRLGTFATRTIVDERQAIPVPAELPAEQACLIGCGVATGLGSVLRVARVWPGASVCVIGCGGVGLSVVQGARIAGAGEIVAIDREPRKLEWAERLGATETAMEPPPERRFDFAFDAVGIPATLEQAVAMLDHAGIATLVGLPHEGAEATFGLKQLFDSRAQIRVSHGGDMLPAEDFPRLAQLALDGRLDLSSLVSRVISLDEVEDGFAAMARGETIRSVVML